MGRRLIGVVSENNHGEHIGIYLDTKVVNTYSSHSVHLLHITESYEVKCTIPLVYACDRYAIERRYT